MERKELVIVSANWIIATFPTKEGEVKRPAARKKTRAISELNSVVDKNFSPPVRGFTIALVGDTNNKI